MNKGIALANGDVIGIINSGDYYHENAIDYIVAKYIEVSQPCVIYGNMNIVDENEITVKVENRTNHLKVLSRLSMWVPHPTMFVSRIIYNTHGLFDTRCKVTADFHFIIKLIINDVRFYKVNEIISSFRTGGLTYTTTLSHLVTVTKERVWLYKNYNISLFKIIIRTIISWIRYIIGIWKYI